MPERIFPPLCLRPHLIHKPVGTGYNVHFPHFYGINKCIHWLFSSHSLNVLIWYQWVAIHSVTSSFPSHSDKHFQGSIYRYVNRVRIIKRWTVHFTAMSCTCKVNVNSNYWPELVVKHLFSTPGTTSKGAEYKWLTVIMGQLESTGFAPKT